MPYKNPLNLEQKARRAKQAKERRSKKSVAPDVAPEYVAPDVAPESVAPKNVAPKNVAPDVAPEYVAPEYVAPEYVAPEYVAPDVAPESVAPEYVAPDVAPKNVAPKNVAPDVAPDVAPKNVAPESVAPEYVAPEYVAPKNVAPDVAPESVAPEYVAPDVAPDVAPKNVAPEYVAPDVTPDVAPKNVAPEYVAPESVAPEYVAPEYVAPDVTPKNSQNENKEKKSIMMGKTNLVLFPLTQSKTHKEEIHMSEPTPIKRNTQQICEIKKKEIPLGNFFKYISLCPTVFVLASTITLLGYFEIEAFKSLGFSFSIALSLTVVLQSVLIGAEGIFLKYLRGETWLHAIALGCFVLSLCGTSFYAMHYNVDSDKEENIAKIKSNSEYDKKLLSLSEREIGFAASYKQAFDEKNFKNARDMKIALENTKADILAHKATEPKTVALLVNPLEENKAFVLKLVRGVLFVAVFIFLAAFRVQLRELTN